MNLEKKRKKVKDMEGEIVGMSVCWCWYTLVYVLFNMEKAWECKGIQWNNVMDYRSF